MYVIPEEEKIWKAKKSLHKSSSKRSFWNGIHSLLRQADARGSADIIYQDLILWVRQLMTSQSIQLTEYIIYQRIMK